MKQRVIPGFGASLGMTLLLLSLLTLLPLCALVFKSADLSPVEFWRIVSSQRAVAAFKLTLGCAFAATLLNILMGLPLAWVLARLHFPGKKFLDAVVDVPFALPTAVAGLTIAALTGPRSWLGELAAWVDWKIAYAPPGIILAMAFTSFPFVVRILQPVLEDLDTEVEEAARICGAGSWRRFFKIVTPAILPALLAGGTLALVRSIAEFGAVTFISGNLPFRTELASVLLFTRVHEFEYAEAAALAAVILLFSFVLLLGSNAVQSWLYRRGGDGVAEGQRRRLGAPLNRDYLWSAGDRVLVFIAVLICLFAVLIPLGAVFFYASKDGWSGVSRTLQSSEVRHAILLTMQAATTAVVVNTIFGVIAAWTLSKYEFPGKKSLTSLIELPFTLSPVILGLCFLFLFGLQGLFGRLLDEVGVRLVFNPLAVCLVTTMVTTPYIFREVFVVMNHNGKQEELAALSLGAGVLHSFWRVTLPNILPAILFGALLCFARAMGEFGGVAVVSGSRPGYTNTVTLQVDTLFHAGDVTGAFVLSAVLALLAVLVLLTKSFFFSHSSHSAIS